ncbi:hypothetical protein QR680_016453 [Steinernema hermaphroditum]|uniref:Serpentine receptor class gamma n=1 Tax=Steinernema hermaphroditum TaxID=289476 RepID=A0AA39LMP0_9BILA|nr:hypothetical protein QR680_016453 [Steinernema hermaphroditum]
MAMPALQFFSTVFAVVSCVLNCIVVVVIVKYRKTNQSLNGSFFSLIILNSCVDVIFAVQFNILMRARKYRMLDFILKEGNALWYIVPRLCCFHYYIKAVHYMINILLAFNRFTSTFYPMYYEVFWQSKKMFATRILAFVIPVFFVLPIVLNFKNRMWLEMGVSNETVRFYRDEQSTQLMSTIDASLSIGSSVICLTFYVSAGFILSRRMIQHGMQRKQVIEFRMFLSSFLLFILLPLNSANHIWTIIASKQGKTDVVMLLNDISYPFLDVMYSASPWVLLVTSSAIRDALRRFVLSAVVCIPQSGRLFKKTTTVGQTTSRMSRTSVPNT